MELITENDLADELEQLVVDANGNGAEGSEILGVHLEYMSDTDGPSDEDEDPEATAKATVARLQPIVDEKDDVQRFLEAAHALVEHSTTRLALERARMRLEDCHAEMQRLTRGSAARDPGAEAAPG